MPGVAPEQHRLTRLDDLDLAAFGVRKDKGSLEHEVSDVRPEDGAVRVRVETAPARRQRVDKHVDQVGRRVDPVRNLPGFLVTPEKPGRVLARDCRWPGKRGPRRGPGGSASLSAFLYHATRIMSFVGDCGQ